MDAPDEKHVGHPLKEQQREEIVENYINGFVFESNPLVAKLSAEKFLADVLKRPIPERNEMLDRAAELTTLISLPVVRQQATNSLEVVYSAGARESEDKLKSVRLDYLSQIGSTWGASFSFDLYEK